MTITRCVYCERTADTKDHIPPKGVFPDPRPSDLITVPACTSCNADFMKDDEYFKIHLGLRADVQAEPRGQLLAHEVARAMGRSQASRFAARIRSTIRPPSAEELANGFPEGLLGQQPDTNRLMRTVARMIRGLHHHLTGLRIPSSYVVRGALIESFPEPQRSLALALMTGAVETELASGQFSFVTRASVDDVHTTSWLLVFFGAATFYGSTYRLSPPSAA